MNPGCTVSSNVADADAADDDDDDDDDDTLEGGRGGCWTNCEVSFECQTCTHARTHARRKSNRSPHTG